MLRGFAGVMLGLMFGGAEADQANARSTESVGEVGESVAAGGRSDLRSEAGRLVVESRRRVRDGRDLAKDSEGALRRVEVRAEGIEAAGEAAVADQRGNR